MENSIQKATDAKTENKDNNFKIKAVLFFTSVAGISALIGFSSAVAAAKRHDTKYFNQGIVATSPQMKESGAALAIKALSWGTLYAFTGCGVLFYGIWKLSGAQNFEEFRHKVGKALPRIPKNDPPQSRTEFSGINDLFEYLINEKSVKDK
ncbi:transmembrane protein 242 [Agrilus planipennis]|uniref:Transmembrane protein 242 n=1 Tax=Agrilus planipennis TaxID=224129 RepID=A0A1W4WHN5_AGRPL|nr:transmembrane protein 242 [Agrilus planipennis]